MKELKQRETIQRMFSFHIRQNTLRQKVRETMNKVMGPCEGRENEPDQKCHGETKNFVDQCYAVGSQLTFD